jgi:hypothetical protein
MDYDQDKVDEMTLALLWLTSFKDPVGVRAWKGQDWDTMDELGLPANALQGRNRLTRTAAFKAVLFKLVPRAFHLNFLLSRNIQTHLEERRGTSLCVHAERSFIRSFEVSTELTIHRHALDLLPVQLQLQSGLGSETTRELYRNGWPT